MEDIHKLRCQISRIVSANFPGLAADFDPKLRPPSDLQLKTLRQLLAAAFIDQIAIRKDLIMHSDAPDGDKSASTRGIAYRAVGIDEDVYIHPSSVTFHSAPPEAVVYQELLRTSKAYIRGKHARALKSIRESLISFGCYSCSVITKINTAWLSTLGKPLCTFSRVLETAGSAPSKLSARSALSLQAAKTGMPVVGVERECFVVPRFADFDGLQLAPVKATQKRVGSRWVFV